MSSADGEIGLEDLIALKQEGQWFRLQEQAQKLIHQGGVNPAVVHLRGLALANVGAYKEAMDLVGPLVQDEVNSLSATEREEVFGLLGRLHKGLWCRHGERSALEASRHEYLNGFEKTGGYFTGINAASMTWLLGEEQRARDLASRVLNVCRLESPDRVDFWNLATVGEASLLLGDADSAREAYKRAIALCESDANAVSSKRQLILLRENGLDVPDELIELLSAPPIIFFTGHMIDALDRPHRRFPPELENAVREAITSRLNELNGRIGYCSAACGADILFIEALLDLGGEVNIILPFDTDDFIGTCVSYAGEDWVTRFRRCLANAHSVAHATEELYLGDDHLFAFANQLLWGQTSRRAHELLGEIVILAVVDPNGGQGMGGTVATLGNLPRKGRRSIIELPSIRNSTVSAPAPSVADDQQTEGRVIASMLFADVKGFSLLRDESFRLFTDYFGFIANWLKQRAPTPDYVRTVGDGIFTVMRRATDMALYALELQSAVDEANRVVGRVDDPLPMRIALHAAPIYSYHDPISDRPDWFGSHVNRTARLEPITVPGHIYATQQFIALLTHEEDLSRDETDESEFPWISELIGELDLAENFGLQRVFHVMRHGG